jgi:hypothetical protein
MAELFNLYKMSVLFPQLVDRACGQENTQNFFSDVAKIIFIFSLLNFSIFLDSLMLIYVQL